MDGAGFDGAAGHTVDNAAGFVLGNRMRVRFFEGAHAVRAVTAHTRQDNPHRFALGGFGHGMEQYIDGGAMAGNRIFTARMCFKQPAKPDNPCSGVLGRGLRADGIY